MSTQLHLTMQQQWLWMQHRRNPDWNCTFTYDAHVRGELNIGYLRRALAGVVRRHTALRTRIVVSDDTPIQQIDEDGGCPMWVVGVEGECESARRTHSQRLYEQICRERLDLAFGPLLKLTVLALSSQQHWLVLSFHHLVMDCFSVEAFFRDLWWGYAEALKGQSDSQQLIPPQYSNYARWQESMLATWQKRHASHWAEHLAGAVPVTWPVDAQRTDTKRGALGKMRGFLDPVLSAELRAYAQSARTLSAVAALAIYVATLARWCRQTDFVVPFNVAGRQSEHQKVIGYFSHLLYLRIRLTGSESFSELLRKVANEFFRALTHQDFGAVALQRPELLTGTFFQWITWAAETNGVATGPALTELGGLVVEPFSIREFGDGLTAIPPGVVDVEVSFFDTPQGTQLCGVYRADRFSADTMSSFMAELHAVAVQYLKSPGR